MKRTLALLISIFSATAAHAVPTINDLRMTSSESVGTRFIVTRSIWSRGDYSAGLAVPGTAQPMSSIFPDALLAGSTLARLQRGGAPACALHRPISFSPVWLDAGSVLTVTNVASVALSGNPPDPVRLQLADVETGTQYEIQCVGLPLETPLSRLLALLGGVLRLQR